MSSRVAVFFLHTYNEVDHISPIIYKWLENREIRTEIVLTGLDNLSEDYRIKLLKQYEHSNVRFAADIVGEDTAVQMYSPPDSEDPTNYMEWRSRVSQNVPILEGLKDVGRKLPTDVPKRIWRRYRTEPEHPLRWLAEGADDIFKTVTDEADQAVLTFDWANAHPEGKKPRIVFTHKIVELSHTHGFETVAWPHGDRILAGAIGDYNSVKNVCSNIDNYCEGSSIYNGIWNNPDYERKTRNVHDYWVIPNEAMYPHFSSVIDEDRIRILGSPRFNQEWTNIISERAPKYQNSDGTGDINILLLLQTPDTLMMREGIEFVIRFLISRPEVNLIIKAHTRLRPTVMKLVGPDGKLNQENERILDIVYNDVHTTSLIDWCDLVADMGTSAVFEGYMRNTAVAHLSFVHGYKPTLAEYFPDSEMESFDDLHSLVCEIKDNPDMTNYTPEQRGDFVDDMIKGPYNRSTSVLTEYVKFIDDVLHEQALSLGNV